MYQWSLVLRRLALSALLVAIWTLPLPSLASAHAHLMQADPGPDSVVAQAPPVASFLFDEPLDPALTHITVADHNGKPVTSDTGHLAPGHGAALWLLPLPRLRAGTYSVYWTSGSATDGHVMSSFYTFRVSPAGTAAMAGAVNGTATGSYTGAHLTAGALATALVHWLGLMAQALWLGALIVELAVLAPARRRVSPAGTLARCAAARLWRLGLGAAGVTLLSRLAELGLRLLQDSAGVPVHSAIPATLHALLSSSGSHQIVADLAVLTFSTLLMARVRVPDVSSALASDGYLRPARASGIVAAVPAVPRWQAVRVVVTALAGIDMLLAAMSGHAANITPAALSFCVDWLHLVCTAAWAGGIATLACGILPLLRQLQPAERIPALLSLLRRYSPVAYLSVAILSLSGLYNAANHVATPSALTRTFYGELLLAKSALIGLLMLLSAAHVFYLRPRLGRLRNMPERRCGDGMIARRGPGILAALLYTETVAGALVLLAAALMSQSLPPTSAAARLPVPASNPAPAAISASAATGDLRARLTIIRPSVGAASFMLTLSEGGHPVTADTGAALLRLYPPGQPQLRAIFSFDARGADFTARGSLPKAGPWRADVLVRTARVDSYRTLPFAFTVGPGADFIDSRTNPNALSIAVAPGRFGLPDTTP